MKIVRTLSSLQKWFIKDAKKIYRIHFFSYFDGTIVVCDTDVLTEWWSRGNERFPVSIMDRQGNYSFDMTLGQVGTERHKTILAETIKRYGKREVL